MSAGVSTSNGHRYKVLGTRFRGGRQVVRVWDRIHDRTFFIHREGVRLVFWSRAHERPKHPVQNPTLRKLADKWLD
jgi:hypothetical protein